MIDPDAILQLRIPPPPLPLPWGRTIRPYVPPEATLAARSAGGEPAAVATYLEAPRIVDFDFSGLNRTFQVRPASTTERFDNRGAADQ